MIINNWMQLPEKPVIDAGDVQVWFAWLDEENSAHLWEILSADERARATRLLCPQGSRRFIVTRGILRIVLGQYLMQDPKLLVFSYGINGKPALAGYSPEKLSFNLSHSTGLAVYAVANGMDVGVDIEEVHPINELDAIASVFLSTVEQNKLKTAPHNEKLNSFFTLWTCKEAILKAAGTGLTHLAKDVKINLQQSNPPPASIPAVLANGRHCQLTLLSPAKGYTGALASFG